jgi:hypothetical protein
MIVQMMWFGRVYVLGGFFFVEMVEEEKVREKEGEGKKKKKGR